MRYVQILNKIEKALIGVAFPIAIFWNNFLSLYAAIILPVIGITSLINIFIYIKDKESGKTEIASSVFWLVVILAIILREVYRIT